MDNKLTSVLSTAKDIHSNLANLIEVGMDYLPYLGSLLQARKFNRFQRRLNEHSEQLNKISKLSAEGRLSAEYIQERIFPIVLSDIIEEHEDAKINLILNGFENVFIEENKNESVVINYFDTLRSLRYADVKRFYYLSGVTESYYLPTIESDEHALIRNIDNKLINSGLIGLNYGEVVTFGGNKSEGDTNKDKIFITLYGKKFLKFYMENQSKLDT